MAILLTFLIIILIVPVLYVFSTQRTLVHLDEMANNSLSQIAVQLQSRWDAVKALVKLVRQYSEHEYKTLTDTIAQRQGVNTGQLTADDLNKDVGDFNRFASRLMAVAEQYPDLKADRLYQNTMQSVKEYEENVRVSRMVYNDTATRLNRMIRQWPSSFVASMLHFTLRTYLEATQEAQSGYPDF